VVYRFDGWEERSTVKSEVVIKTYEESLKELISNESGQ